MAKWKVVMPVASGDRQLCLEQSGTDIKLCVLDAGDSELAALTLTSDELAALSTMTAQAKVNKQLADM